MLFIFIFAILFFSSKYVYDYYSKYLKVKFICPLGKEKFGVDNLKFNESNLKMLEFIETTREELLDHQNKNKIAEDDEYEYFVEK